MLGPIIEKWVGRLHGRHFDWHGAAARKRASMIVRAMAE